MPLPPSEANLVKILQGLLVADIVLAVLSLPLALVAGALAEAARREAGLAEELSVAETVVGAFSCLLVVVLIPAQIASWIGLFNFRSWARWLYLATTLAAALSAVLMGFLDFSLTWGLPDALDNLMALMSGAILALIFLSPLARRFAAQVSSLPKSSDPSHTGAGQPGDSL